MLGVSDGVHGTIILSSNSDSLTHSSDISKTYMHNALDIYST